MSTVRQQSLIFPREHGAWGILLVPLVTGASVGLLDGGSAAALPPLTIAVLALFWMRTPLESWIGTTPIKARSSAEATLVRNATLMLGAVAMAALIWLFWGFRNLALWQIGAGAATAFLAQMLIRKVWRGARTTAQLVGAAGLTSVAAAAYYVVAGQLNGTAWSLWAANFLFAANQIQYVQLRIHAARALRSQKLALGRAFFAAQFVLMGLLILACISQLFRWYAALAFLPLLLRGFAWFAQDSETLVVQALGKRELAHAIAFGVLLIAGFHFSGIS
ncbi:MAG TPA: YwiC-like family protein [Bryobacteraceae bacterium]|nr:YwiC-like family protein [Bryobacteraceae bacterium]